MADDGGGGWIEDGGMGCGVKLSGGGGIPLGI